MIERLILVVWASAAAGIDARHRRLPNWLTLGGLMAGALYAVATGTSLLGASLANGLSAAAVAFFALFPAYLAGWMGAGDVKLFAAMGMLGGSAVLLSTLLVASILTGIGALAFLMLRARAAPAVGSGQRSLPFGIGLASGFALSVMDMLPMLAWKG